MPAPASKSYNYLKRMGFKVESPSTMTDAVMRDLFGLYNVLAVHPTRGLTLAVFAVSENVMGGATKKILESRWTPVLLTARWNLEVHGWQSGILDPRIVRFMMRGGKPSIV